MRSISRSLAYLVYASGYTWADHYNYVHALEARIKGLENTYEKDGRGATAESLSPCSERNELQQPTTIAIENSTRPHALSLEGKFDADQDHNLSIDDEPPLPRAVSSQRSRKRYGKSSSIHFALHVNSSAAAMADSEESGLCERQMAASPMQAQEDELHDAEPNIFDEKDGDNAKDDCENSRTTSYPTMSQPLPHPRMAEKLLSAYFETVHPIWPLLLEAETWEQLSCTWTSKGPPDVLWLVQLNLIMCLGYQTFETSDSDQLSADFHAKASGKAFYEYAKAYVYANAFIAPSIRMLQALLLMAVYQQGALQFKELYLTVGRAARIAQSLGVHISRPEVDAGLPQHRELRRRLWWSCFCLDR